MKQFHFEYDTIDQACAGISGIRDVLSDHPGKDAMVFLFLARFSKEEAERLIAAYDDSLPEVKRVGISGGYSVDLNAALPIIKCNLVIAECGEVFHPFQIPCAPGGEADAADALNRFIDQIPDVKGVAFYPSGLGLNVTRVLRAMDSKAPFFGAMAIPKYESSRMLNTGILEDGYGIGREILSLGFTVMVIAGQQVTLSLDYILGWEPIGREMDVTIEPPTPGMLRAGETELRLIDGKPALEIYRKYLGVEWNEDFIMNVCEFPLMVQQNGVDICFVPMNSRDGRLSLIGNVEEKDKLRFSYSTREAILSASEEGSKRMAAFEPEAVVLSLCGNRINFLKQDAHLEWDYYRRNNPNLVYCHGQCEIAYKDGKGGVLNSALVAVGIRECDGHGGAESYIGRPDTGNEHINGFIPLEYRVSHFFHVMTEELVHFQHHLEDEVEKKTRENEGLSFHVVQTLAEAIDAKDTYTNGHSGRVAKYSREIARRLGLTERQQNEIFMMGLLHDVGKIGVPDAVINKPGRLTDEEFAMIKTHPATGARILEKIREMPGLAVGAHWHHERIDGKGYPDGLKGEMIPEPARIIAVADAYDAMTSNRSYRDVMPQEKVREQIEKGLGTQFDPVFGKIMLQMIDEDTEYQMREG